VIIALCQYGVLKPMCELLGARDDKVIGVKIKFVRRGAYFAIWDV